MGCRKAPHPLACWAAVWPHGRFGRRRARPPARLGVLTSFGAAPRSPPVPSGPSGALHTSGARSLIGASSRCPATPRHRPRAPPPGPPLPVGVMGVSRVELLGCLGACCYERRQSKAFFVWISAPVVTNVVNPRAFSLKMAVFGLRLTTFVTGVLVRRFESRWFDDVCNVGRPPVARPGPATAHGHRSLALSARPLACLKPLSPLRAPAKPRLKPPSPLRVRNGCFWCSFRVQW